MLTYLKTLALPLFLLFFTSKALAVMLYSYNCPVRKNLVIGRAQYRLNSLQWSGNYFVGIGERRVKLEGKDYLHMIFFRNGDRFFYGKSYGDAYMIYAKDQHVHRCTLLSAEKETVLKLSVYRPGHG